MARGMPVSHATCSFACDYDPATETPDCLLELNAQLISIFGMQLVIGNIQEARAKRDLSTD